MNDKPKFRPAKEIFSELFEFNSFILSLTIINLIPLFGVIFFNWNVLDAILIYWLECFILGFYLILQIILSKGKRSSKAMFLLSFLFVFSSFLLGPLLLLFGLYYVLDSFFDLAYFSSLIDLILRLSLPVLSFFILYGVDFFKESIKNKKRLEDFSKPFLIVLFKPFFLSGVIILGIFFVIPTRSFFPILIFLVLFKSLIDIVITNIRRKKEKFF